MKQPLPYAIETFKLTKQFPQQTGWRNLLSRPSLSRPAVNQVDIAVKTGELFSLVGPNGAGKTTLIKLITTLIIPTSGIAHVNGYDLRQEREIKSSIGLAVSDERSFYWRLTGQQNLEFFATLNGLPPQRIREHIHKLLEQVGLSEVSSMRFQAYSTGMRQRLSIARALINNPRLLFLDEPTKGLDPIATRQIQELIVKLCRQEGITVFLTTHNLNEAQQLSDRIAIMNRGQILACDTVPALGEIIHLADQRIVQAKHVTPEIQARLEQQISGLKIQFRREAEGIYSLQDDEPAVFIKIDSLAGEATLNKTIDILRQGGALIQSVSTTPASLETIFSHFLKTPPFSDTFVPQSPLPPPSFLPFSPAMISSAAPLPAALNLPRIIFAFLARDVRSEASYRVSFFLQFFSVFFSVGVFYYIAKLLGGAVTPLLTNYGGDYFSFVLIGVAFSGYFGVGLSSFANNLRQAQTTGTLEAMLITPTSLSTIILCSSLWDYLLTTLRVLAFMIFGAMLSNIPLSQANYLAAILILGLTILAFSSLGILAASFIMVLKRGDPVTWLFNSVSNLLGGVYYPINILPGWVQVISRLLPITYALNALRLALLKGASLTSLLSDVFFLVIFSITLLPASLVAFRFAVRQAKIEGSLTHY